LEFATVKGFKDILPEESPNWQRIEAEAKALFEVFGFREIKTPVLEKTELFSRSIGLDTDIVSKEMYSFPDSRGQSLSMRPEATASIVRAYIQHRLYQIDPVQKLYTIGPMFRHERPQKGRFRQFHQVNAELFGDPGPRSDADLIAMAMVLVERIGLSDLTLHLNSLGCPDCRPAFKEALKAFWSSRKEGLCADCLRRAETNPLRVLDCKVETCRDIVAGAPSIVDYICSACQAHFQEVQMYLGQIGLAFILNPRLVRGLDYYTRTTFEIQTDRLGAQNAIAGGGRYDGLIKLLGGPDHPAIGFALGMERAVSLMEMQAATEGWKPDLYIAALGDKAEKMSFQWSYALRKSGCWIETEYGSRGLKAHLKRAGRMGARNVLIVGDNELQDGYAILRDMETKDQEKIGLDQMIQTLIHRLSRSDTRAKP
jgi:histidyl-tRNA synthetase